MIIFVSAVRFISADAEGGRGRIFFGESPHVESMELHDSASIPAA